MDKASYKKLGVDVYQGTTSSGLKYVLTPVKNVRDATFGIAFNKGGSPDELTIDGSKIPLGTAHYLEHRMFQTPQGDGLKIFMDMNADSNAFTSRDTTFYYFTTLKDYIKPLGFLFDMVTHFYMTEEDVERERPIIIGEIETNIDDPAYQFSLAADRALYFDSPLMYLDFIGTPESLKQVHLGTLRKFFKAHYGVKNMTLFGTGNLDPKKVVDFLEGLKLENISSNMDIEKVKFDKEDYTRVKNSFVTIPSPDGQTYLGVAIKLPKRKDLVEKFGDLVFAFYEILPELVFSNISKPIDQMMNDGLIIMKNSVDIDQDGEDAAFTALFETNAPEKLQAALEHYLNNLGSVYSPFSLDFKAIKMSYFGNIINTIGKSSALAEEMISGYENHLAWPGIAARTLTLSLKDTNAFLKTISKAPRAFIKLAGKKEN